MVSISALDETLIFYGCTDNIFKWYHMNSVSCFAERKIFGLKWGNFVVPVTLQN